VLTDETITIPFLIVYQIAPTPITPIPSGSIVMVGANADPKDRSKKEDQEFPDKSPDCSNTAHNFATLMMPNRLTIVVFSTMVKGRRIEG